MVLTDKIPLFTVATVSATTVITNPATSLLQVSPASNAVITLPSRGACDNGYYLYIKNTSATFTVTVTPFAGNTIDGSASSVVIASAQTLLIYADPLAITGWRSLVQTKASAGTFFASSQNAVSAATFNISDATINEYFFTATGAGASTVVLPLGSSQPAGQYYIIHNNNTSTQNILVTPNGANTIDGYASAYTLIPGTVAMFLLSGTQTNWDTLSGPKLGSYYQNTTNSIAAPFTITDTRLTRQRFVNATGGTLVVNLPSVATIPDATTLVIVNSRTSTAGSTLTLTPAVGQFVDNAATLVVAEATGVTLVSDAVGLNWVVV